MDNRRYFCGWEKPILTSATQWLFDEYVSNGHLNLDNVVILFPGGRAGRRLLELLVHEAEKRNITLTPPTLSTPGFLAERFIETDLKWANPLQRHIAWVEALQKCHSHDKCLEQVIPHPPEMNDWLGWKALADRIDAIHSELAGHRISFCQVAKYADELSGFNESQRWHTLETIHKNYLESISNVGLVDPHDDTERALKENSIRSNLELITIAAIDLNQVHRAIFDQIGMRAKALIQAPDSFAEGFDEYGTVIDSYWTRDKIAIDDSQLIIADRPIDQAVSAIERITHFGTRFSANQITLGLCDETLASTFSHQISVYGLTSRNATGLPLSQTRPARLLGLVGDWLDRGRYGDFASLIRHIDIVPYLERECGTDIAQGCETVLDHYQEKTLRQKMDGKLPGHGSTQMRLKNMRKQVADLCSDLKHNACPLREWAEPIINFLLKIYGQKSLERYNAEQRIIIETCEKLGDRLREWTQLEDGPKLSAANAIRLLLMQVGDLPIPPEPQSNAIEMLGPLELVLDDAPLLIIAGFNDGGMPTTQTSDMLLPDRLRREIGLNNNEHRLARDCAQLRAVLESDRETVFIAGRRDEDDNPLVPSRLMLTGENIAERVKQFTQGSENQYASWPADWRVSEETNIATPPEPKPLTSPIQNLRVTAFRDYLACPYRFYLRHIENLTTIDDIAQELSGAAFGSLAHEALQEFAELDIASSTSEREIQDFFDDWIKNATLKKFGSQSLPAIHIQMKQLSRRFHAFARWQADWSKFGWKIERVEIGFTGKNGDENEVPFDVDDELFCLRGRIDRIDRHQETGRLAVIDYKTGDSGKGPEKVHRKNNDWVDLQLPLYRVLVGSLQIGEIDKLGYFLLPKNPSDAGPAWAHWEESDYEDAENKAREIIRNIRQEKFWPPSSATSPNDIYADLCGVGQIARTNMEDLDDPA